MKKICLLSLCFALCFLCHSQTEWSINLNNVGGSTNANFGTLNNKPVNFYTNNTQKMVLETNGNLKIKSLEGTKGRLVFADSVGNLFRLGSGSPSIPVPGDPCMPYAGPWYEGGNYINTDGRNVAGTCNNYDFILKANNVQSIFVKTNGKVGVGQGNPQAALEVYDPGALGGSNGASDLILTKGMSVNSAYFKNNIWIVRDNTLIDGAKFHDGLISGSGYGTPGVDTQTWWERFGNDNVQAWGHGATTYMKLIDQGRLCLGNYSSVINNGLLNLNTNGLNAIEVFDAVSTKVTFKLAQNGKTIIGYQLGSSNLAMANINVAGGSSPTNALDVFDQYSAAVNFRVASNGKTNIGSQAGASNSAMANINVAGGSSATNALDIYDQYSTAVNFRILSNGKVNIGSQAGSGNLAMANINVAGGSSPTNALDIYDQYSTAVNFRIASNGKVNIGSQAGSGNLAMANINVAGGSSPTNALDIYDQYSTKVNFRIKSNGYVFCREINVMPTSITFPDYVFEKDYDLLSIHSLEKYIREHKHLPNIPSAAEVETDGLNIADLQIKQMEKIEEAFLYIIQLQKENEALKKRLDILESQK